MISYFFSYKLILTCFQNASASINITVLNVNDWDPRFRFPQYEFFVSEIPANDNLGDGVAVGMVEAADGDRGDKITLSLQGTAARLVFVRIICA